MDSPARDLARRLGECAEAVCRRYLAAGRKEGRYWLVGDVRNAPGQSLYVRLSTSADGRGAAGKWTDAHTGEHGDLLDIIAVASGHHSMRETLEEARRFLSLPQVDAHVENARTAKARPGTAEAARRLWAASKPIERTVVSRYLEGRALVSAGHGQALRFHPSCYYRPSRRDSPDTPRAWPAMIAAVTDLHGAITGVHRTWLEPATCTKAHITNPRRAMGGLLGNGVRFGLAGPVMVAAEGIETTLSLRQPDARPLPEARLAGGAVADMFDGMVAALSCSITGSGVDFPSMNCRAASVNDLPKAPGCIRQPWRA
jgi:hypothetical protein